jgi:hypothetical protein
MSDNSDKPARPARLAEFASDLSRLFQERQRVYAERAQDFGYASESFSILATNFADSPDSDALGQAEHSLREFGNFVRAKEKKLDGLMFDVSSATYALSTSTTSAMTVSSFEAQGTWDEHLKFPTPPPQWPRDRTMLYAARLAKLNAELGKLARSIWQHFYGGTESSERASLLAMRQLYDHLFAILAPDEEVRLSRHFRPKGPAKANQIYRKERLLYAADVHVRDSELGSALASEADQVLDTYEKLNQLHARSALNREAARQVLLAMQAVVEQWVDALEL